MNKETEHHRINPKSKNNLIQEPVKLQKTSLCTCDSSRAYILNGRLDDSRGRGKLQGSPEPWPGRLTRSRLESARVGEIGCPEAPRCAPRSSEKHTFGCGSKLNCMGLRGLWSMCPLTKIPFWYRLFEKHTFLRHTALIRTQG